MTLDQVKKQSGIPNSKNSGGLKGQGNTCLYYRVSEKVLCWRLWNSAGRGYRSKQQ